MLKENYNSSCEFAEQMVSYLYGETDARDKNGFEAHLQNCSFCADEFASFNTVRSSILEWRDADFSSLDFPGFETSEIIGAKPQILVETENLKSRFGNFWSNLIFNPAFVAAILLLLVGAGIFIYSHQFSNNADVAEIPNESKAKIFTSPTAEKVRKDLSKDVAVENKEAAAANKSSKSVETSTAKEMMPIEKSTIQNSAVKVSTKLPKNKSIESETAVEIGNSGSRKIAPVRKSKVPALTDTDEDEDDSVRLADLFAEIDTK